MKKAFYLIVAMLFIAPALTAQVSFNHSLGGAAVFSTSGTPGGGLMYSPRLNIADIGRDGTISIGTHLTLGAYFSGSTNSRTGSTGSSSGLTLDLPLVVEANFGHMSSDYSHEDFGGFFGVGFGYSAIAGSNLINNSGFGPLVDGGVRIAAFEKSFTVKASYMLNIASASDLSETRTNDVVTIGAAYNFGY